MSGIISLPVPPSVNAMFANLRGRGRIKTAEYRKWLAEADGWLLTQKPLPKVTGPYRVRVSIPRTRGDCDNRLKAILDLLARVEITPDDRHCMAASIEVLPEIDCCIVAVEEVP